MREPLNATMAVEKGRIVTQIKTNLKKMTKEESSSDLICDESAENNH